MHYLCKNEPIRIRKMEDCAADYNLMVHWLSDPMVLQYYEGLKSAFDMEKVLAKFRPRVLGESPVASCIIEIYETPAGYIQYYPIKSDADYDLKNTTLVDSTKTNYGIDLFIAEDTNRNKGLGTKTIRLLLHYLFAQKNADEVFIDPQTWNTRAIKCYEKSGFTPITTIEKKELVDGELKDSLIMSISKANWHHIVSN